METNCRTAILENPAFSTDKAVSLPLLRWNLIGYDGDVNISLADAKFINSSGTEYTWANAVAANKMQAYLSYYDASSATASERKFKYVGTSGVDDTILRGNKGYWMYSNEAGNLTLPGVGGSVSTEEYVWNKLRFSNGTDEYGIGDVGSAGLGLNWVETTPQYWGWDAMKPPAGGYDFLTICNSGCDKSTFSAWEGVFIKGLEDNITIIRQN